MVPSASVAERSAACAPERDASWNRPGAYGLTQALPGASVLQPSGWYLRYPAVGFGRKWLFSAIFKFLTLWPLSFDIWLGTSSWNFLIFCWNLSDIELKFGQFSLDIRLLHLWYPWYLDNRCTDSQQGVTLCLRLFYSLDVEVPGLNMTVLTSLRQWKHGNRVKSRVWHEISLFIDHKKRRENFYLNKTSEWFCLPVCQVCSPVSF